jgi:hypothetical protein
MRYDIDSLKEINRSYDYEHGMTRSDVDMANKYVEHIERTRSDTVPKAGDCVRYTTEDGDYYGKAHIEFNRDGECNICERPSVPFIWYDGNEGIKCFTSGGAWANIPTDQLVYIGREEKRFTDWGHCGSRGNGAVGFFAEVSVWEYIHPEPLYEGYTTEKWRKVHVSKVQDEDRERHDGYLYLTRGALSSECCNNIFRTDGEYSQFLRDYKAKVFHENYPNKSVVFCYREQRQRVSREQYDSLCLPVISIYYNGKRPAKIEYDDENKMVKTYFVTP